MSRRTRHLAPLLAVLVLAGLALAGTGTAATSTTVVTATVPSASTLDASGCAAGTAGVTEFGNVLPGSSVVTSTACSVTFGSSNDTSRLRIHQTDGTGRAMWSYGGDGPDNGFGTNGWAVQKETAAIDRMLASATLPSGELHAVGFCNSWADLCTWRLDAVGDPVLTHGGDGIVSVAAPVTLTPEWGVVRDDGVSMVTGTCNPGSGARVCAIRLRADGSLDPSWGSGGVASLDVPGTVGERGRGIAFTADGGAVLGVRTCPGTGFYDMCVARFDASGQPYAGFGSGGLARADHMGGSDESFTVLQAGDGSILAGGACSDPGGTNTPMLCVARFDASGDLDDGFGGTGIVSHQEMTNEDIVWGLAIDSRQRIVAASYCTRDYGAYSWYWDHCAWRINDDGTDDNSFGGDGVAVSATNEYDDYAYSVEPLEDGRVLLVGRCDVFADGGAMHACATRFLDDGTLDPSFGTGGFEWWGIAGGGSISMGGTHVADGQVIIPGGCVNGDWDACLYRTEAGGTIDDYAGGSSDWDDGTDTFGACLLDAGAATALWSTTGTCTDADGPTWNAVPAGGADVAHLPAVATSATVQLHFGLRVAASQPATTLYAPISFEVVAPTA